MSMFNHIIFDLDGTLTDSKPGIANSLKYAMRQMHLAGYSEELLDRFIGPPLQDGFKNHCGLNEQNTQLAVDYFRTYYGEKGLFENTPYTGIAELLEELHFCGKQVYVATSKLEKYAIRIMRHFELDRCITDLIGAEYGGNHSGKGQLIAKLLERNQLLNASDVVMVGDTIYDIDGSHENEIPVIAVGYGFGKKEQLLACSPDYFAETVDDLCELLL